jgi:hypothetical protein
METGLRRKPCGFGGGLAELVPIAVTPRLFAITRREAAASLSRLGRTNNSCARGGNGMVRVPVLPLTVGERGRGSKLACVRSQALRVGSP